MYRLRSSAAPEDGRCIRYVFTAAANRASCDPRPPRRTAAAVGVGRGLGRRGRCDPRPPRRTAAAPHGEPGNRREDDVAILGRPGGRPLPCTLQGVGLPERRCDPRPPRRTAAAPSAVNVQPAHPPLRSSAAPEDGRCLDGPGQTLGRPGGRPLRASSWCRPRPYWCCDPRPPRRTAAAYGFQVTSVAAALVAILGRPGGRPLHGWQLVSLARRCALRSSAAPEDGRCPIPPADTVDMTRCDPRPPRRTAAAQS